ncbi:hypothetical protein DLH72_02740 [Candidatus Gracilibacteria bacterium]|nr:MAG: hypothetical protein DLH72_02740 [Candidatus Gracilibacteria bacterium]
MKKFIAFIVFCILSLNIFDANSFLKERNYIKNDVKINSYKEIIEKNMKGKDYIKVIDQFLKKSESKEKLETVISRMEDIIKSNKITDKFQIALVSYIYLGAKERLIDLESEKRLKEVLNPSISEEDKKTASKKIEEIQSNFYINSIKNIEETYSIIKKEANVIEKGNFDSNFYFSDSYSKENISGKFNFNDIESKNTLFDSEVKGKIELNTKVEKDGKTEKSLKVNSDIKGIYKSGDLYFLFENLEIENKLIKETNIEKFIDKIKELSKENKYIKISDKQSQLVNNILGKAFDISTFSNYLKIITEKPLFEAYKKQGDKYFLRPTQNFCNILENPIAFLEKQGEKCSSSKYENLLKDFAKNSEIYLTVDGNDNKIFMKISGYYFNLSSYIIFDNKDIKEIKIDGNFPSYDINSLDVAGLHYVKNSKLDAYIKSKEKNFEFNGILDKENNFKTINSNLKSNFVNGFFKLENKKFSGELKADKNFLFINGELDISNKISKLDLDLKIDNLKGKINFQNNNLTGKINMNGFNLDLDFYLDDDYIPRSGNLNLNIENFLKTNLEGRDGNFNGRTTISNGEKNVFEMEHKIFISKNSFSINDKFIVNEEDIIKGNIRLDLSHTNIDLEAKGEIDSKEIFNINIKANKTSEKSENISIEAPKNYVEFEKILPAFEYYEYEFDEDIY